MDHTNFLDKKGNYHQLIAYQKSECLFDITFLFTTRYLLPSDRTVDQMRQAARSCKQNIAEGSSASATSSQTEILLTNVAKANLKELLEDYVDYLRLRGKGQWSEQSERFQRARRRCGMNNDSKFYMLALKDADDVTIANVAIILCKQTDYLLFRLLEAQKKEFPKNGGFHEQMYRARKEAKNKTENLTNP